MFNIYYNSSGLSTILPLFENADVSVAATWHSIMKFSLVNHLSYAAMSHLLQLLAFILPNASHLPKSIHLLKKEYCCSIPPKQKYCSNCVAEIEETNSCCQKRECKDHDISWFVNVPFHEHLKQMCQSK